MSDEAPPAKATIGDVYRIVGELEKKVMDAVEHNAAETRRDMRDGFQRLETAITCLRDEFVTKAEYRVAQDAQDAALVAAVKASEADRETIWTALHDIQAQAKWAAGSIVTAFIALIVWLFKGHATF